MILVNSITTGGDIVLTGTSVSDNTQVPLSDTETITVDTTSTQMYQTTKKWLQITSIDVTSGTITGIDYNISALGYTSVGNRNFVISGYRIEAVAGSSGNATDIRYFIEKVKDDGSGKMSIVYIEDIEINNTNSVTDHVRSGISDRSFTATPPAEIWPNDSTYSIEQNDFDSYFTSGENVISALTLNDGIIIRITGDTLGSPSGTYYIRLQVRYYLT
jgi:hypothetical protein